MKTPIVFRIAIAGAVIAWLAAASGMVQASVQWHLAGATDPVNNTAILKLTYLATSDTSAILTIEATNTSNFEAIITGIAINNPLVGLTKVTLTTAVGTLDNSEWYAKLDTNNISSPQPFGKFDVGLLTGNNLSGGDPQAGIQSALNAPDNVGTLTLLLVGTGLDDKSNALFEQDFFHAISQAGKNDSSVAALVRFQQTGSDGEGSDVGVPGYPEPTPEPTALLVWGSLVGLVAQVFRRRNCKCDSPGLSDSRGG